MNTILDNIGLPYSTMNTQHATSGLIGAADADIIVSLNEEHTPTADFVRELRTKLPSEFPGTTFYFLPADIVSQILNFGLPAPIDVQIDGTDDACNRKVADRMLQQLRQVPGLVDVRLQQPNDYPVLDLSVDRTKAQNGGYSEKDVGSSVLNVLSGSSQLTPMFFLNPKNGVTYSIIAETPQYQIQSLNDLENIPLTATGTNKPEILADVASISRSTESPVVNEYNIRRTVDVYGNVQDRDLGAVARDVQRIIDQERRIIALGGNFIPHARTSRNDAEFVHRSAVRSALLHRAGLSAGSS